MERLERGAGHREAGHCRQLASSGIPDVLGVAQQVFPARKIRHFQRKLPA
jgi:hypothetical protein